MFSYQSSLLRNLKHSIRMSDGQVMVKIQSWSLKNITEKLPEHNSTLNEFFLVQMGQNLDRPMSRRMFSYQSGLLSNLNHSIRLSDGQVMTKIQSWGQRKKTG